MPTSHTAHAVLIEGPDAIAFAHSQFTSQVATLAHGRWQFSSWLDAQGRVRHLFHLARLGDERLLVLLRGGNAMHFIENLRPFVFRSRVKLSVMEGMLTGDGAAPLYEVDMQSGLIGIGCETHTMLFGAHVHANDAVAWQLEQLREGWAWLPDNALSQCLPPNLSLHRLGGVALNKGCYPGQEIVARLHCRGGNKRHLHRIALSKHMAAGSWLQSENHPFMRLLNVVALGDRVEALAIMSDETASHIRQSGGKKCSDEGVDIQLLNTWPA